ncbi:formate dehydrogenase [Pullulanibacillus camelliae]|uniref:Formate dehydrogenase n=1 Tax=Pullulanibacillus camelliae TaxID=1707096 RepID=A0A8J2VM09_9BACL|nr:DinB family protein [Pullulanibacillus camelliae]GGE31271.1 formate dehydrogenase [Pullulanibacillus camelliae]
MSQHVFTPLKIVRQRTINAVKGLSDHVLDTIPEGFNNNVRWNLGHVYLVQENFAFRLAGEPGEIPEAFNEFFAKGTKPADWDSKPPTLETLIEMLENQSKRIEETFKDRLDERVKKPFTTESGLNLNTIGELLTFSLYHEGIHFNAINLLKRFAEK